MEKDNKEIIQVEPSTVNYLNITDEYKKIIDNLKKEPHYVDRDGDLYTIICPHCGSKNVGRIGMFFICGRRHIFSLYTEDGVRKDSELSDNDKKRILGNDFDPKIIDIGGIPKDAHGHEEYNLFNRDDKVYMYFSLSLWGLENDTRTLNNAKIYLDMFKKKLREFADKFKYMSLESYYFYTDFDEALVGKSDYRIISRIFPVWMEKAIVIANEIDKMDFNNEEIYANLFYVG